MEITNLAGMMIGFGRLWSDPPGSWLKIAVQKVVVGILRIGCSLARFVDPRSQALRPLPRGPRTSSKFSWRFAITHGSGVFVLILGFTLFHPRAHLVRPRSPSYLRSALVLGYFWLP